VADDLSDPLGQGKKHKRSRLPNLLPVGIAGLLACVLRSSWSGPRWSMTPYGGEPVVVLSTDARAPPAKKPDEAAPDPARPDANSDPKADPKSAAATPDTKSPPAEPPKGPPAGMQTVTIIDGGTGNRQEVLVPAQGGSQLALADPKLVETTRHGPIPRVSLDGARALVAYARPPHPRHRPIPRFRALRSSSAGSASARATPRRRSSCRARSVSRSRPTAPTSRAWRRAPAPKGTSSCCSCRWSRSTIRTTIPVRRRCSTSLAPEQNIDRMHWLMSRFKRLCRCRQLHGLALHGQRRLVRPDAARGGQARPDVSRRWQPRRAASRARSRGANGLPFAKANVVLDAVPTPERDRPARWRVLEGMARDAGIAVGVATALPVVDRAHREMGEGRRGCAASCWCRSARPRSSPRPADVRLMSG